MESVRPWIATALRTLGVVLLALALAEPRLKQANEHVTVLFVLDRSLSVPQDFGDEPGGSGQVDRRAERIRRFINNAVEERSAGPQPRPGRPDRLRPAAAPGTAAQRRPAFQPHRAAAGAATATTPTSPPPSSWPSPPSPRTPANASSSSATATKTSATPRNKARLAKTIGVQIDVVPLAAGQRNEDEVLVERVEAPSLVRAGIARCRFASSSAATIRTSSSARADPQADQRGRGDPVAVASRCRPGCELELQA